MPSCWILPSRNCDACDGVLQAFLRAWGAAIRVMRVSSIALASVEQNNGSSLDRLSSPQGVFRRWRAALERSGFLMWLAVHLAPCCWGRTPRELQPPVLATAWLPCTGTERSTRGHSNPSVMSFRHMFGSRPEGTRTRSRTRPWSRSQDPPDAVQRCIQVDTK